MQHLQKGCSKSGHGVIFATKVRVFADVRRSAEFQTSVASRLASLFTRTSMHYGFSYHFSGNGTYFFQINIVTSIFIENCWNLFYMIDNSQKSMPNIFLIKYDQYLQRYLQKTWRGRHLTLKFCVSTKQTVTWKKVENNNFRWGPLQGANIFQIFSVIMFFKKYLEPDLLGKIQLVPQLPLRGHCNLSEIIKTQENVKGESNMWKKWNWMNREPQISHLK